MALRENKGVMPTRIERLKLAQSLKLREKQIYKWFWEILQKQSEISSVFDQGEPEAAAKEENILTTELTAVQKFEILASGSKLVNLQSFQQ